MTFAHLPLALLERSIHIAALHPPTCLLPSEVDFASLTQQSGGSSLQMSDCFQRPSVSRSSRGPICPVAPGARVVSSALAHCVSGKNSRWQRATSNGWHFPVVRCSHFDSQWQMLSDTFWEESQRKQCLCTKAHHWRLTVTCHGDVFFRRAADVKSGMFFYPWISPDALCSFTVPMKRERNG